jgi:hypothetical protein
MFFDLPTFCHSCKTSHQTYLFKKHVYSISYCRSIAFNLKKFNLCLEPLRKAPSALLLLSGDKTKCYSPTLKVCILLCLIWSRLGRQTSTKAFFFGGGVQKFSSKRKVIRGDQIFLRKIRPMCYLIHPNCDPAPMLSRIHIVYRIYFCNKSSQKIWNTNLYMFIYVVFKKPLSWNL